MRPRIATFIAGCLMALSCLAAGLITPTHLLAEANPRPKLEQAVPTSFGGWQEEKQQTAQIINPHNEEVINKIYAQTLSRTYVNQQGGRIMLSVAYGVDQRRGNEVHYPDVCYPAQGFEVTAAHVGTIPTPEGTLHVSRLETNLANQRYEPLTYWTTIGNEITPGGMDKRMKELSFGIKGQIPDGLVFRVSSIDHDSPAAFALQEQFVQALVQALAPPNRLWLAGLR
jgi:EpsI family protein